MKVKLWGVRGSLAAPMDGADYTSRLHAIVNFAEKAKKKNPNLTTNQIVSRLPKRLRTNIGGETTCVELTSAKTRLIFDMGTGARKLGYDIMAKGNKGDVEILMTHTHWDHMQGWPFFVPAYIPGNRIQIHSALDNCQNRFERQQDNDFFPVPFSAMASEKKFHKFSPGDSFTIGDMQVSTMALPHPGGSIAYRIECEGKVFIFSTDTEFFGENLDSEINKYRPFYENADLVVMDAQYSLKEAEQKIGWGHTAMVIAVDCSLAWGVKSLVFTHHEPAHDDNRTFDLYFESIKHYFRVRKKGQRMRLRLGIEGAVYQIE